MISYIHIVHIYRGPENEIMIDTYVLYNIYSAREPEETNTNIYILVV